LLYLTEEDGSGRIKCGQRILNTTDSFSKDWCILKNNYCDQFDVNLCPSTLENFVTMVRSAKVKGLENNQQ